MGIGGEDMANTRRLMITVVAEGFLVETEYQAPSGRWNSLSRTTTRAFPLKAVDRVAGRNDFKVFVRVADQIAFVGPWEVR
jgi:hypothetical protein